MNHLEGLIVRKTHKHQICDALDIGLPLKFSVKKMPVGLWRVRVYNQLIPMWYWAGPAYKSKKAAEKRAALSRLKGFQKAVVCPYIEKCWVSVT